MKTIITFIFALLVFSISSFTPEQVFAHSNHKDAREQAIERFRQTKEEKPERLSRFEHQQEVLLSAIDSLLKHAEVLLERVEDFPVIAQDTKTTIQDEIHADIAVLQEFKEKVLAAKTEEQLRQLAQELKEHRTDISQKTVRKLMLLAHVGVYQHHLLDIAAERADRIAEKLDEFEQLGKEVAALEELLEQAKNTIIQASEDLETVKLNIAENDIDKTTMTEVQDSLKNIRDKIKTAYSLFRDIAKQASEL